MTIQFLGAAREVTGSKHLVTTASGKTILLDCGMYQGKGMETDAANRDLGFDPKDIHYVLLSHAHIDHTGLVPYIYKLGFRGKIFCTAHEKRECSDMRIFVIEDVLDTGHGCEDNWRCHEKGNKNIDLEELLVTVHGEFLAGDWK